MATHRTLGALLLGALLVVEAALPGSTAAAKGKARAPHRGPTVQVSAQPVPGKADTVTFTVHVGVARHRGALYYRIAFGDRTVSGNAKVEFCLKGRVGAASRTWHVTHRYHHPGTFHVTASGGAVCTRGRGVDRLKVHVA